MLTTKNARLIEPYLVFPVWVDASGHTWGSNETEEELRNRFATCTCAPGIERKIPPTLFEKPFYGIRVITEDGSRGTLYGEGYHFPVFDHDDLTAVKAACERLKSQEWISPVSADNALSSSFPQP